jgi:hypothetical protein
MGSSPDTLKHAGGAAMILKCRGSRAPKNELERKLLMSLRGPVVSLNLKTLPGDLTLFQVFQAYTLDESFYTEEEWDSLVNGYTKPVTFVEHDYFPSMAKTARLFQKARALLSRDSAPDQCSRQNRTEKLLLDTYSLRTTLTGQISDIIERLKESPDFRDCGPVNSAIYMERKAAHTAAAREYGLIVLTQIEVNLILTALLKSNQEEYGHIAESNGLLCRQLCDFCESEALDDQPLTSWVNLALCMAYIGASGKTDKERAEALYMRYDTTSGGDQQKDRRKKEVRNLKDLESFASYLSLS